MINSSDGSLSRRREKENTEQDIYERIKFAYSTLNFNQGLIQFAESKANSLLLINSIFLATATTVMQSPHEQSFLGAAFNILRILFFIASIISVIVCLLVVIPVKENGDEVKRHDMIFFMDILHHKSADHYISEFIGTKASLLLEDLLKRCYGIARIAGLKFSRYRVAQTMTFLSCILWLGSSAIFYLK